MIGLRVLRPALLLAGLLAAVAGAGLAGGAAAREFTDWLAELRREALARGISEGTLDAALDGVQPIPRIIELDRRQPEFTQTFREYLGRRVTDAVVRRGHRLLAENRALLERVRARFGVQPRFLVALWGIETNFGRVTGGFHVIPALVTLAFDERRSAFFRKELLYALQIVDEGHISADRMMGSWAGAMGQNQFMPKTFANFAIDFDGDGRRDIWTSRADVFASAANYLARSGWRGDQTWGREVRLPPGFDPALAGLEVRKRLSQWQALGVRRADGSDLPRRDLAASVILPDGPGGPAYVVYDNYEVLLTWNRSILFATTVGYLADRLQDG